MEALVSVVVPVWNGEKTLDRCLDSILTQSYPHLEIIVVDDGSTDGTWALLCRRAQADPRLKPIRKENGGVADARNEALPLCRGKYVRFVDCDDAIPADSIATLVQRAEDNGSDLVLAAYTMVVGNIRKVRDLGREQHEATLTCDEFLKPLSRYANSFFYGVLWNKLFRTELIARQHVRFTSGLSWGEDFVFVVQYLAEAQRVTYCDAPVYDYIRNPGGLTVRQAFDCVLHPFHNISMKYTIYRAYRELYRRRGQYESFRGVLWRYMIRVTLNN